MVKKSDTSLIILTYKGKVLLLMPDNRPTFLQMKAWSFINGKKKHRESSEQAIRREVVRATSINLQSITFISPLSYEDRINDIYHAELTDTNVNEIKRDDGKELQFFTLREIEKLPLELTAKSFVSLHKDVMERVIVNQLR